MAEGDQLIEINGKRVLVPEGQTLEGVLQRFAIPPVRTGPGQASKPEPMTLELMKEYAQPDGQYHKKNRRIPL